MAKLNINDTSFEYVEQGAGEAVVFVHGTASDYRTWRSQIDEVGKRYRAIAYSRRYHWPNARIAEGADYVMEEHVADLAAVLRSLHAAPAHVVGHSYGGFVALLLALREPRLVRSLVLAEPPVITLFVSNRPKAGEILRLLFKRPRTAAALLKLGVTGFGPASAAAQRDDMESAMRIMGNAVLGPAFYKRTSASRLDQVSANAIKAELLGSGFPPIHDEELRSLQVPALLVNGQRSPRVFHRLTDRLEELLPCTERIEISEASHPMHEHNAPAYNAAVLGYLAKHGGDSTRSCVAVQAEPGATRGRTIRD